MTKALEIITKNKVSANVLLETYNFSAPILNPNIELNGEII